MDYYDEYHNEEYEIFDAAPNNVLYGKHFVIIRVNPHQLVRALAKNLGNIK